MVSKLVVMLTVVVGELDGDVNEIASILLVVSFTSFDVAGHQGVANGMLNISMGSRK